MNIDGIVKAKKPFNKTQVKSRVFKEFVKSILAAPPDYHVVKVYAISPEKFLHSFNEQPVNGLLSGWVHITNQ